MGRGVSRAIEGLGSMGESFVPREMKFDFA